MAETKPTAEQLAEEATLDQYEEQKTLAEATPPEVPETSTPKVYKHSRQLTQMALDAGMSLADIEGSTPDELHDFCLAAIRREKFEKEQYRERALQSPQREVVHQPEPEEPIDLGLSQEEIADIHPGLIKAIKHSVGSVAKQNKLLQQQIAAAQQNAAQQAVIDRLDNEFGKYSGFLGEGRFHEMVAGSAELSRRIAVDAIVRSDTSNTSLATKVKKAVESLGFKATKAKSDATPGPVDEVGHKNRIKEFSEGTLARATGRNGAPETKGEKAAVRAVNAKLQELGAGTAADIEREGELPD